MGSRSQDTITFGPQLIDRSLGIVFQFFMPVNRQPIPRTPAKLWKSYRMNSGFRSGGHVVSHNNRPSASPHFDYVIEINLLTQPLHNRSAPVSTDRTEHFFSSTTKSRKYSTCSLMDFIINTTRFNDSQQNTSKGELRESPV